MKKQILPLLLGLSMASMNAHAATPKPADHVTQLLSQIASNTHTTSVATDQKLNQALETLSQQQKRAIQNRTQYLYASQNNTTFDRAMEQQLGTLGNAQTADQVATQQYVAQNLDQPYICDNLYAKGYGICAQQQAKTNTMNVNGETTLEQADYTQVSNITTFASTLFKANLQNYHFSELPDASLAMSTIGAYIEARTPSKNSASFMSQLKQLVMLPSTAQWQTAMSKQSLSDRMRTLTSMVATLNYLNYLRLQAAQKRNLLLSTAILQRVQQNSHQSEQVLLLKQIKQNQDKLIRQDDQQRP